MKKLFIPVCAIILFASCSKTKTNTVTVTKTVNDTTTISFTPTIIGSWKAVGGTDVYTFTSSTWQLNSEPAVSSIESLSTVYDLSQTNIVYPRWNYSVSAHNDSLYLTPLSPAGATAAYTRN